MSPLINGALVVIKNSVSLCEDQHVVAKASLVARRSPAVSSCVLKQSFDLLQQRANGPLALAFNYGADWLRSPDE